MSGGFVQTWPKGRTCRCIPIRALGLHGNLRPLSPPRFSPRFFVTCHACFGVRSSSAAWDQSLPQESYCTYGLWGWRIQGNSPNGLAHRLNRPSADLCPPADLSTNQKRLLIWRKALDQGIGVSRHKRTCATSSTKLCQLAGYAHHQYLVDGGGVNHASLNSVKAEGCRRVFYSLCVGEGCWELLFCRSCIFRRPQIPACLPMQLHQWS